MSSVEDKQIAKEILLKLIDAKTLGFYGDGTEESNSKNVDVAVNAFSKILGAVSGEE